MKPKGYEETKAKKPIFVDITSIYKKMNLNNSSLRFASMPLQSDPAPQIPSVYVYMIFVFNGVMSFSGLIGNMFVCLIIIRGRKMYTIANLFLLNLAVADMCVLVVSYPLWVIQSFLQDAWPFGPELCIILPAVSDCFYGVSLGCMMTISIHRYRMIAHAMRPQMSFFQAKLIVVFIWFISLATISVPLYPVMKYSDSRTLYVNQSDNGSMILIRTCVPDWRGLSPGYEQGYQLALFFGWYILPLLVILITFLLIRVYLRRQMLYGWLPKNEQTSLISKQILGIKKALRMLAPVVVVFAILMLPWNLLRIVSISAGTLDFPYFTLYVLVSGSLLVANSVVNPFIYYIFSQEFRLEFRKQFWLVRKYLHIDRYDSEFVIHREPDGHKYIRRFESVRVRRRRRMRSTSNGSVSKRKGTVETKCSLNDLAKIPTTPTNAGPDYFEAAIPPPSPFANRAFWENGNASSHDSGVYCYEQDDVFGTPLGEYASLFKTDNDSFKAALAPASHLSMIAEESCEMDKEQRDLRLSLFFRPKSICRILSEQETRESIL